MKKIFVALSAALFALVAVSILSAQQVADETFAIESTAALAAEGGGSVCICRCKQTTDPSNTEWGYYEKDGGDCSTWNGKLCVMGNKRQGVLDSCQCAPKPISTASSSNSATAGARVSTK